MIKTVLIITVIAAMGLRTVRAQEQGIKFEKALEWGQIIDKAKAEHKYIFVDCYATWCGPCKAMERDIYPLKEVGEAYNKDFICVKMQMDQTKADNDTIKNLYRIANMLASSYDIKAYPTFLFFDPDGNIVHKVIGARDEAGFIQLAKDAQNQDKQYYSILKDFRPGKLDTADLKGLARVFAGPDTALACKLALDYLTRIPKSQFDLKDNQNLMAQFQYNPKILAIAVSNIKSNPKSEIINKPNFIVQLRDQPPIQTIAVNYIKSLNKTEMGKEKNLQFIIFFHKVPEVRQTAKNYINDLTENQLYTKPVIDFLTIFCRTPEDAKGFNLFYHHSEKVDQVMGDKEFAQDQAQRMIENAESNPKLDSAKANGVAPDFDGIKTLIAQKYNAEYADKIALHTKVSWYAFQINNKRDQYWPDYITAMVASIQQSRSDTIQSNMQNINNIAFSIFQHGGDQEQLMTIAGWMRHIVTKNPDSYNCLDTYACVLYKAGQKDEAIQWENKALQNALQRKNKDDIAWSQRTVDKMSKGEQIWLEKEYQ